MNIIKVLIEIANQRSMLLFIGIICVGFICMKIFGILLYGGTKKIIEGFKKRNQ